MLSPLKYNCLLAKLSGSSLCNQNFLYCVFKKKLIKLQLLVLLEDYLLCYIFKQQV